MGDGSSSFVNQRLVAERGIAPANVRFPPIADAYGKCESLRMTALLAQRLIAVPFLVLGSWCLFLPHMVERLGLRAEHYEGSTASALLIGCFGAQAVLSGLFAAFSRFTRTTFLVYGLALLPFVWFNYWFVFVVPVFSEWMALDFVANVAMLALCVIGYRQSSPGLSKTRP